jgi:hypothetical protein
MAAFRDLERLAKEFATDLRKAAWDSGVLGGDVVVTLRDILEDTLDRIRTDVFGQHAESAETGATTTQEASAAPESPHPAENASSSEAKATPGGGEDADTAPGS